MHDRHAHPNGACTHTLMVHAPSATQQLTLRDTEASHNACMCCWCCSPVALSLDARSRPGSCTREIEDQQLTAGHTATPSF